jgi:hypothetical protein
VLDLEKAKKELSEKNLNDIQKETAITWASRAAVSFENCLQSDGLKKVTCFAVGEEYLHEALEHAALVEGEDVLSQIKREVLPYQEKAAQDVDRMFSERETDNI